MDPNNESQPAKTPKPSKQKPKHVGRHSDEAPRMERRMAIHRELQDNTYPNKPGLARKLEVGKETIDDDFDYLIRIGMPLEYDKRRKGFYYRHPVADLPNIQTTESEIGALAIAAHLAGQLPGPEMQHALHSITEKLQRGLPKELRKKSSEIGKYISVRYSFESLVDQKTLETLYRNSLRQTQIKLGYRRPGEKIYKPRVLNPLHLIWVNGEWFLFAEEPAYKKVLRFAPIRMRDIEETGETFERPANFSVEKELENSFGIYSKEGVYDIILRVHARSSDFIREKSWRGETKKVELPCGGIDLHLTLTSLVEIERFVGSHLGNVVALGPRDFQERCLASGQKWVCEQLRVMQEGGSGFGASAPVGG